MSNLGPNLGLEEEILSGCCLHYTGTKKKKQQKDSAGFAFIPPSMKQAGHMWGEEEGRELMKLWVCLGAVLQACMPLRGFTRAPETPLEGSHASKSNACPRAGKRQGNSCPVPCQNPPSSCCAWLFFPGWSLHPDPGPWSFSWDVQPKSQNLQWSL